MKNYFVSQVLLPEFGLWERMKQKKGFLSFELEVTARCNNNCRHCYINLPAGDEKAIERELTFDDIKKIVDEAVSLGALWCLITGGEPLLREDFFDIYCYLKKKGLLVSIFTNATLVTEKHVRFFKRYPPRDIEVTVYGTTPKTYEQITRSPGSFEAFINGLNLLIDSRLEIYLKTIALRSNAHELDEIVKFCQKRSKGRFRFDPFLNLRFDGNAVRNQEIRSERLSAGEIAAIEQSNPERLHALKENCSMLINFDFCHTNDDRIFLCGSGTNSFGVSYDGLFRLCPALCCPSCTYDLKKGTLSDAWKNFTPRVRDMRSNKNGFSKKCLSCPIINLCMWCPATSYLETGELDRPVDYFCDLAHARARFLCNNFTCSIL